MSDLALTDSEDFNILLPTLYQTIKSKELFRDMVPKTSLKIQIVKNTDEVKGNRSAAVKLQKLTSTIAQKFDSSDHTQKHFFQLFNDQLLINNDFLLKQLQFQLQQFRRAIIYLFNNYEDEDPCNFGLVTSDFLVTYFVDMEFHRKIVITGSKNFVEFISNEIPGLQFNNQDERFNDLSCLIDGDIDLNIFQLSQQICKFFTTKYCMQLINVFERDFMNYFQTPIIYSNFAFPFSKLMEPQVTELDSAISANFSLIWDVQVNKLCSYLNSLREQQLINSFFVSFDNIQFTCQNWYFSEVREQFDGQKREGNFVSVESDELGFQYKIK